MRLQLKSGFAMAALVAASFAFAGVTQAAPMTGTPREGAGLIQQAHYTGHPHSHCKGHKGKSHHYHHYHHHYHHHLHEHHHEHNAMLGAGNYFDKRVFFIQMGPHGT